MSWKMIEKGSDLESNLGHLIKLHYQSINYEQIGLQCIYRNGKMWVMPLNFLFRWKQAWKSRSGNQKSGTEVRLRCKNETKIAQWDRNRTLKIITTLKLIEKGPIWIWKSQNCIRKCHRATKWYERGTFTNPLKCTLCWIGS